jgi:hypothetical protein
VKLIQAFALATTLIFSTSVFAAKVIQVKGAKVLVDMEGDEYLAGEEFFLINPATSKKTAIIRIKQTKNGKAVAEIVKGKADAEYTLQAKSSSAAPTPMSADVEDKPTHGSSRNKKSGVLRAPVDSWGIVGEYLMIALSTSFTAGTPAQQAQADMKGSTFGAGGYYNHMFGSDFSLVGSADIQQFTAAGSANFAACAGATTADCSVNITYLSLYGLGRWYVIKGGVNFWIGAGGGFLLALTKKSNVLKEEQISTNQVFSFALGGEYQLSRKNYIPFSFQYDMFPSSGSVTASMMSLKGGYGWNF